MKLEEGRYTHSLWKEMTYQLAGRKGFERIQKSDKIHNAPGDGAIFELFGGEPALILIGEIPV